MIADAKLARAYLDLPGGAQDPGRPVPLPAAPLTTAQVLRKLVKGQIVTRRVTIIEGLTLEETAEQLAREGYGRREVFLDLMRSPRLIADLDPDAPDLEGYLFPETYSFAVGTGEQEIVETLVKTFRQRFERDVRPRLAHGPPGRSIRAGGDPRQHRRERGEGVRRPAADRRRLPQPAGPPDRPGGGPHRHLRPEARSAAGTATSTARTCGWTPPTTPTATPACRPGPICSPGLASLVAAAAPADVPYLYFVSRNDGTHVFAQTLAEHNRNVEIWQRKYWRDRWAAERRQREAGGR